MSVIGGAYVLLIVALIAADVSSTSPADLRDAWADPAIRYATYLSLATATASALLSVAVATPIAYVMTRGLGERPSPGVRAVLNLVDALLDIPLALPPLVVGVSLLILFRFPPFAWVNEWVVYEVPAVVLAQFVVACAFAVRAMRSTFEQVSDRQERVAQSLGASRAASFWTVLLPQARPGLLAAATVSWSRSLGEFGPVLVFASSTRFRTEVLPTSVYLEMQAGNLRGALAVSLMMIALAVAAMLITRWWGRSALA